MCMFLFKMDFSYLSHIFLSANSTNNYWLPLKWDNSWDENQNKNAKKIALIRLVKKKKNSNKLIRACENNLVLHVCPSMVHFLCCGYYTTLAFIFLYFMPPWIYVIVIAFATPIKYTPHYRITVLINKENENKAFKI